MKRREALPIVKKKWFFIFISLINGHTDEASR